MGHCLRQLAFFVPHDHDHALGQRGDIVSARAPIKIADLSGVFFQERRVDVTETVYFEGP